MKKRTENRIFSSWNSQNYVHEHEHWTIEAEQNEKECYYNEMDGIADVKSSQKIKSGVHILNDDDFGCLCVVLAHSTLEFM